MARANLGCMACAHVCGKTKKLQIMLFLSTIHEAPSLFFRRRCNTTKISPICTPITYLARSFTLRLQQTTQLSSSLPKGWHPQSELPFFHALASSLQMPQSLHRFRFICLRGDLNAARDLSLARILSLILASAATPFLYQPLSLELDSS